MKKIYGLVMLLVVIAAVVSAIIVLFLQQSSSGVEYSGRYYDLVKNYYASIEPSSCSREYIRGYIDQYLDKVVVKTLYSGRVVVGNKTGFTVPVVVHKSMRLYINVSSNNTVYYTLSLDQHLNQPLLNKLFVNNTVIDFGENITEVYSAYIVFFSDIEKTNASITVSREILNKSFIIEYYRLVLATLIVNDVWSRYSIVEESITEINSSRNPLDIIRDNSTKEINEYEAIAIASLILKTLDLKHLIGVIDLDGDNNPDHLSILLEINGTAEQFLENLTLFYREIGREDIVSSLEKIHIKYITLDKHIYLVIDPLCLEKPLIPGCYSLPENYKLLGVIIPEKDTKTNG